MTAALPTKQTRRPNAGQRGTCPKCRGADWWRPIGALAWRCCRCEAPPRDRPIDALSLGHPPPPPEGRPRKRFEAAHIACVASSPHWPPPTPPAPCPDCGGGRWGRSAPEPFWRCADCGQAGGRTWDLT